jgi:chromosomal replication initiator protein
VSEQSFTTWFRPIRAVALKGNVLTVQVPTRFSYEWIEQHYLHILKKAIREELGEMGRLAYSVPVEKKKNITQRALAFEQNSTVHRNTPQTTLSNNPIREKSQLKLPIHTPNTQDTTPPAKASTQQPSFDFGKSGLPNLNEQNAPQKRFVNPNSQNPTNSNTNNGVNFNSPQKLINRSTFEAKPTNTFFNQNTAPTKEQAQKIQIETHLNPKLRLSNYVQGECNKLGCSVAYTISQNPGLNSFNPLMIFGGVGVGKTHLANAIGNAILENDPTHRIMYIHADSFTAQFVESLRQNTIGDFTNSFLNLDTLIVDDVQGLAEKRKTQEVFFYIFNHLHQLQKQIILTSDRMPSQIKGVQNRLLSRFKWGLSTNLDMPDFETRREIIRSKMLRDDMQFSDEVIDYVAKNVQSNVRELEGVLISLIAQGAILQAPVDIKIAARTIESIVAKTSQEIVLDLDQIQEIVGKYFDMPLDELISKSRKKDIVQARQIAMYFCNKYTDDSLKVIGKYFGKRDHSTVIHACKSVEKKTDLDECYKQMLEDIEQKIKLLLKPKG